MLMKTSIVALALTAATLAAPVPGPASCTSAATVKARGYGIVCTSAPASKREPASCSDAATVKARGYGIVCTSTAASKRDGEEAPALEKRTGMGIISSGSDDA